MLTFSPDGTWLLVANEAEPNADYSIDPEGSVSVVDMRRGAAGLRQSEVRTADFVGFNNATLDPSIRIFGPEASRAQDIEPEYLTVSHDSRTAWVTCQENNALAIIDIKSSRVTLVYDSGDALERITAAAYPANFNASNDANTFDNRSDDKGPEPEGVVIGKVFGSPYAFVGLERIGGVAVFEIADPEAPRFVQYVNNRDFAATPGTPAAGDLGPEGLLFISAEDSPNRRPLLVVGNEISSTTTIYEIRSARRGR
jgi:hypothetical protein